MSRSNMAKSRVEKAGKAVSAPTPAQVHDIVPGRYNDQDWHFMLERDDGEEFITDIIEEVCDSALDIIYKSYIDRQLIPYTVSQAKDAIVQIIEWQFLARDEGEGNIIDDVGWLEDEEPMPAITDCWAQGSVPKVLTPREPTIYEEAEPIPTESMPQITEEEEITEREQEEPEGPPLGGVPHERTIIEEETTLIVEGASIPTKEITDTESQKPKTKKKFKPHYGPLRSAGLGKMTKSLEQTEMEMYMDEYTQEQRPSDQAASDIQTLNMPNSCQSIVKLQAGRPPGRRDVFYDEYGNVVSVNRINPENLPTHKIKTRFNIVDPEVEAAQDRLEAMRTGRYIKKETKQTAQPVPPTSEKGTTFSRSRGHMSATSQTVRTGVSSMKTSSKTTKSTRSLGPRSPLPPPLIESMEVAPGVVVREGERIKKGPRQRPRQEDLIAMAMQRGFRPVKLNQKEAALAVSQILENRTPVVKPLVDQSPIPPIPSYQRV